MSSVLKNFVTIRKTRGDVLSPAQYRTIVEMIRGILKGHDFSQLNQYYHTFLDHLANKDDPHHASQMTFFDDIVTRVYAIYITMTATPLSFNDYKSQIVPSLGFLELIRRIVLNRYFYNQVKTDIGSVPLTAQAYLSNDWDVTSTPQSATTVSFGSVLQNEQSFIALGLGNNTSPIRAIFTADNLGDETVDLPIVFETSSAAPYLSFDDIGFGYTVPLSLVSNDITVVLGVINKPLSTTTLFSLKNGTDTVDISMDPNEGVILSLNNTPITALPISSPDGKIEVVISNSGFIALRTNIAGSPSTELFLVNFTSKKPFISGTIGVGMENLTTPVFGLRNLLVYAGYDDAILLDGMTAPDGYLLLTDPDGAFITDSDGNFLTDIDLEIPAGYSLLLDSDGSLIMDSDGSFLIDVQ